MFRFSIIILIVAAFSLSAFAADTLNLKVRVEQLNGTVDQTVVYPTFQLSKTTAFASYLLYAKVSEISTGFKFIKDGAYVWPLVGMLYNSEKGYGTHFRGSLHIGYENKYFEFTGQNMIDIANKRSTDDTYHRWWAQVGDKNNNYHSRFGVGAEVSNPRGKKATVNIGPKLSFFKNGYRVDLFHGIVAQDGGKNTPPTTRLWVYIPM